MKRFLVVLFGVLVFQANANAQSDTCFEVHTWNGGAGPVTAKVRTPASDGFWILNKGAPFLLQWEDREEILGDNVKVTLKRVKGDEIVPLGDSSLNNLPNTGYALISKRSLKGKNIKTGKENKHYFQIEKVVGTDKAVIKSGCFTFHPKPERTNNTCHGPQKMRECVASINQTLLRLQAQIDDLEGGGAEAGQAGGATVKNKKTTHYHDGRYAKKHSHNKLAKSSHSHEDYVEKDSVQSQIDTITTTITTVNSQVSALQARLDALEVADNASILPEAQGVTDALDLGTYQWRSDGDCLFVNRHGPESKDVYVEFRRNDDDNAAPVDFEMSDNSIVIILADRFFESSDHIGALLEHWKADAELRFDQKRSFELKRNGNCWEELEFNQMSGMHKLERQWLRLYRTNGLIVTHLGTQDYEQEIDVKLTIIVNNEEQRKLADFEVSDNSITLKLKNEVTNPMTIIKEWQNWRRENSARNFNLVLEDQNGVISQPLSNEGLLSVCGEQSKMYWRPCAQL